MKRDYLNTPSPPAISSIHYERSRLFKIKSYSTAAGRIRVDASSCITAMK